MTDAPTVDLDHHRLGVSGPRIGGKAAEVGSGLPERVKSYMAGEYADDYPRVVVMLDARTRVVECAGDVQWSIQKRGKVAWRGVYYFRSKAGLLFYAKSSAPELMALPDWFPERGAS
jgi:hypothetical protein